MLLRLMFVALLLASCQARAVDKFDAIDFLEKFNYLRKGMDFFSEAACPEHIGEAVSEFQKIYHIPVTGKLDAVTLQAMKMPRCGDRDLQKAVNAPETAISRYVVQGSKWRGNKLTYRLAQQSSQFSAGKTKFFIKKAFAYWAKVTPLTFYKVERGGHIVISFFKGDHGDGSAFDGKSGVLAHAFSPIASGATHFDDDENWIMRRSRPGYINFVQVATHEFGHALGLYHSTDQLAVMRPYYKYNAHFHLSNDDIAGIRNEPMIQVDY